MRSVAPHIWMFNDGPKVFQCRKRQEVCCSISMKYCSMNFVIVSMPQAARGLLQLLDYYTVRTDLWEFQCRKRQEVCCNLLLCRQSRQRLVRFQCRKRQEVCCNIDFVIEQIRRLQVSMPQAARGLLQQYGFVSGGPSNTFQCRKRQEVCCNSPQVYQWYTLNHVSMPQAARGLLQQRIARTIISSCSLVSMPQAARGLLQHCVLEAAWTLAWKWGFGQPPRKSTHLALFSRGHRFVFLWKTGFSPCCWRVQRVHDLFGQPTPVLTRFRGCPTVF